MHKETNTDSLAEDIEKLADEHFRSSWNGSPKRANKAYKKIVGIFQKIEDDQKTATELTSRLLNKEAPISRHWGMVLAFAYGVNVERAYAQMTKELANKDSENSEAGRIALDAEMLMKNIKEHGGVVLYEGQQRVNASFLINKMLQ